MMILKKKYYLFVENTREFNLDNIKTGSTVAVFGCGGVGLNILEGAKSLNANKIIAVDISDHKLEFAYKFGATHVVNAKNEDPVEKIREITDGGVDYSFDSFGPFDRFDSFDSSDSFDLR